MTGRKDILSSKTRVNIGTDRGKVRLRWSYQGQRYTLATGLDDSPQARATAESIAAQVKLDILDGSFDGSLDKYRPDTNRSSSDEAAPLQQQTLGQVWQDYQDHKAKTLSARTITDEYRLVGVMLEKTGVGGVVVQRLGAKHVEAMTDYMSTYAHSTVKKRLQLVKAALGHSGHDERVRLFQRHMEGLRSTSEKPRPKPLTAKEVKAILDTAKAEYGADKQQLIQFMLLTGLRPGEVAGLTWEDVDLDERVVVVNKQYTKRQLKRHTKTHRSRVVPLSKEARLIVEARQVEKSESPYVFVSSTGQPLDTDNFRNRTWAPLLKKAGVEYRSLTTMRKTFVSHALASGVSPLDLAAVTGHSVQTMYQHYAASTRRVNVEGLYA